MRLFGARQSNRASRHGGPARLSTHDPNSVRSSLMPSCKRFSRARSPAPRVVHEGVDIEPLGQPAGQGVLSQLHQPVDHGRVLGQPPQPRASGCLDAAIPPLGHQPLGNRPRRPEVERVVIPRHGLLPGATARYRTRRPGRNRPLACHAPPDARGASVCIKI